MSDAAILPAVDFTPWPGALADNYRARGFWIDRPLTDLLGRASEPAAAAVICGTRKFSYAELDKLSSRLACVLATRGLKRGHTALVQLPNVAEFYVVFFALLKLGVAPVNALYSHQRLEMTAYTEQLRPALMIGCGRHQLFSSREFFCDLQVRYPDIQLLVLGETEFAEDLAMLLEGSAQATEEHRADFLSAGDSPPASIAQQVAFFQLSGGSTGTPKLIPRTHNDYHYSVRRSAEICRLSSETRYLCALPAAHNFPLSSPGALGVFHAGGTVVLADSPEPGHCFDLIARHKVTMAALVPSAVALWLEAHHRLSDERPLNSLRLLQVGGANFAESLARRVPAELGCQLQQVFGMAEGLVNYTRLDDSEEKIFTTQGCPMSAADEVRVLDEQGRPVPDGETGLLYTRGPYTFRGYYRAPEQNARVFDRDGFYCSGDLVQRDAAGYLKVVGRVKDQINRGGEKIAAEEVENLLLTHRDVQQVALVSIPDAGLGEKSCACVITANAKLKPPQLRRYLRELGLAEFKLPDRFQFLRALPLTAVGKTDKVALRAMMKSKMLQKKREESA
ncbi:(2,3-dihydroxybenzoyl)adenylate synthase [Microbulbifer elongatus]|uniref:(2,3-dihydroxybenzoyl)adenylate synthase n=1 Tax=Microbulbifer elongatus TaxID=86173 RepID=A0ABT1NZ41_9GAMM|nr:(2,3-dihydroxybenzoyl)adenylate synthase [Microbulbifer elongatus]MCQ3829101.1 (2,3-dihydroxybenzoyl)adenylate synthase [Microbulbifer elongatus]